MRHHGRRSLGAVCLIGAVLLSAGCNAPARTDGQFDAKASITNSDTVSQLATLQLLNKTVQDDRMPATTAQVVAADAVADLDAIKLTFAGVRPPSAKSAAQQAELQNELDRAAEIAERADSAITARDGAALALSYRELGASIARLTKLDES